MVRPLVPHTACGRWVVEANRASPWDPRSRSVMRYLHPARIATQRDSPASQSLPIGKLRNKLGDDRLSIEQIVRSWSTTGQAVRLAHRNPPRPCLAELLATRNGPRQWRVSSRPEPCRVGVKGRANFITEKCATLRSLLVRIRWVMRQLQQAGNDISRFMRILLYAIRLKGSWRVCGAWRH